MSTYLVQASPLTKIFLEDWHDKCLADPAEALRSSKFRVHIPRPCGAIMLEHGVPTLAATLIAKTKERMVQEDEIAPLVEWLTNETNAETDPWGVVAVPIETNVADAIMALLYDEKKEATQQKLLADLKKRMSVSIHSARERADARVLRQCGKMYDTIKQTAQAMKKDGKGIYSPSYSEALALVVLKDQITLRRAPNEKAQAIFDGAMADIQGATGAQV